MRLRRSEKRRYGGISTGEAKVGNRDSYGMRSSVPMEIDGPFLFRLPWYFIYHPNMLVWTIRKGCYIYADTGGPFNCFSELSSEQVANTPIDVR